MSVFFLLFEVLVSSSLQAEGIKHPKRVECPYDNKQCVPFIWTIFIYLR